MAEGPTVLRWSRTLQGMAGRPFVRVDLPKKYEARAKALVGESLREAEPRGKNLLLHLSTGDTLRCHAMMYGTWRFGEPGMKTDKPDRAIRLRLRTKRAEAIFYNGPVVELIPAGGLATHPVLSKLGPDLLSASFDRDEAWRRLRRDPRREVADALLDQENVAGIGNIYKSEALFLAGLDPRRPMKNVRRAEVERVFDAIIGPMLRGAETGRLEVRPGALRAAGKTWVYGRRGRPCFRCGSKIERILQGRPTGLQRSTYYCPTCQPARRLRQEKIGLS